MLWTPPLDFLKPHLDFLTKLSGVSLVDTTAKRQGISELGHMSLAASKPRQSAAFRMRLGSSGSGKAKEPLKSLSKGTRASRGDS